MRRTYPKEHHEGLYTGLLVSGKLNAHARMELTTKQIATAQSVTEDL